MNLEQLTFESANQLLVDFYKKDRELYHKLKEKILLIRDTNSMLQEVQDELIKQVILERRKEAIEYVLWTSKQI